MERIGLYFCVVVSLGWRSELYPEDWTPGYSLGDRFLHDFSYAGYHAGEEPLPEFPPGPVVDVTEPPYEADNSGATDVTAVLQLAIDESGASGGGVVYLPAGTYAISTGEKFGLHIGHSHVVLRGDGPGLTRILNTTTMMRHKKVIVVRPNRNHGENWFWRASDERLLSADVTAPTFTLHVTDTSGYQIGDWIVVKGDATEAWIAEHGMTGWWSPDENLGSIIYRRIVGIDGNTITIDGPTRYPILMRDGARIAHVPPHLEEVGVEHLSIGNVQNPNSGWDTDDYAIEGKGAYEVHASFVLFFNHVVNGWIRDVHTFRPAENSGDVHILSDGIRVDNTRFITIEDCNWQRPQYRGAGGNGYLYVLVGSDTLVKDCHAERGRHDYSHSFTQATGNVIVDCTSTNAKLPVDFHQRLSTANLIDNMTMDGNFIESIFRDCCTHGQSASQNVIWRTHGISYRLDMWPWEWNVVTSQQYGQGYVIGTWGNATIVKNPGGHGTEPIDHVEGEANGQTLEPRSLYYDQLARRLGLSFDDGAPHDDGAPSLDGGSVDGGGDPWRGDPGGGDPVLPVAGDPVAPDPSPKTFDTIESGCQQVPTVCGWLAAIAPLLLLRYRRRHD